LATSQGPALVVGASNPSFGTGLANGLNPSVGVRANGTLEIADGCRYDCPGHSPFSPPEARALAAGNCGSLPNP